MAIETLNLGKNILKNLPLSSQMEAEAENFQEMFIKLASTKIMFYYRRSCAFIRGDNLKFPQAYNG